MVNTEIKSIIFFAAKMEKFYTVGEKKRPGADCGSDHELLIAKFRLTLSNFQICNTVLLTIVTMLPTHPP